MLCSYLAGAACPSPAQVLNTTVDGSGLQRWTFTYLAGSDGLYVLPLPASERHTFAPWHLQAPTGRPSCSACA